MALKMSVLIDSFHFRATLKKDRDEVVSHQIYWKLLPLQLVKMRNAKI
jgi:hypothetical protein